MNIAYSADYNGVICYILLKSHTSFAIQQIIYSDVVQNEVGPDSLFL